MPERFWAKGGKLDDCLQFGDFKPWWTAYSGGPKWSESVPLTQSLWEALGGTGQLPQNREFRVHPERLSQGLAFIEKVRRGGRDTYDLIFAERSSGQLAEALYRVLAMMVTS